MNFNSAYQLGGRVSFDCGDEESLTDQDAAVDCDINVLVKRFGVVPPSAFVPRQAIEDFVAPLDYQEALATLQQADDAFSALDARIRDRFGNDPVQMLEFVADDKNRSEAEKLGLIAEDRMAPPKAAEVPPVVGAQGAVQSPSPAPAPKA